MDTVTLVMYAGSMIRIALLIVIGIPLLSWSKKKLMQISAHHISPHSSILLGRIIFYSGLLFIIITALHEFGFNISALLGVAGIFGVAIGFASQTSVSNIISGFFLLLERPFSIGDIIKSNDVIGVVESIGLLSMSIRTLDNKLVRLPNETVLKNNLVNVTYYPQKRIDCVLSAVYADDIEYIKSEIYTVITNNVLFLQEPAPVVMVQKVAQHDYDTEIRTFFTIRVWVVKEKFTSAPAVLMQQLKEQFDKMGRIITITHTNIS